MPASTYSANKLLDLLLRGVSWTPPTDVFVSLHTGDPGNNGANEVSTGNWPAYVRMNPDGGGAIAAGWDAASSKATQNALEILWPAMDGGSNVTVTHFGVWDAATTGNFLCGGALTASKILGTTDELVIHPGNLDVSVT